MQISIQASGGYGQRYDVDIDPSVTIEELKKHLREKFRVNNLQTMCLVFDNELLADNDVLSDFDIKADSTLELINPNTCCRSFGIPVGLKFVAVTVDQGLKRLQWATNAPRWRRVRHGLCLEGQCKNSTCDAYHCTVLIPTGYRKFDMLIDRKESITKCPVCKKYVSPDTCVFNNCWWKYEGMKNLDNGPPQSCSSEWRQVDDAYHRFDEQEPGNVVWIKLILEAIKERPSDTV